MKIILSVLVATFASTQLLHAQTVQTATFANVGSGTARQQDISIPTGQVFKLLTWGPAYNGPQTLKVDGIDVPVSWAAPGTITNVPPVFSPNLVVARPRTVSLVVPSNASLVCSYVLATNGEVATQNVASQIVVIPQNASAPADIILESSTDLISGTAAVAGSYSPFTSNRCFRARLVMH